MNTQIKKQIEALAAEVVRARILVTEIEQGIVGTLYNPSDDDRTPGRICYSDILHQKGFQAAQAWQAAKASASGGIEKGFRMRRNTEKRKLFFDLVQSAKV